MKLFWKIISNIYSDLVIGGLNINPPQFLFNNPKKKLECIYQDIVLVDKTFTPKEQKLISQSIKDLEYFCNGLIKIHLIFDLDPNDLDAIKHNSVLIKATPEHPSIANSDELLQNDTLGLCEYINNDTKRLYLVSCRLTDPIVFRTTSIHEFGHFIGLGHIEPPSIMHKHNHKNVLYPTYKDARELSKIWRVYPGYLRYFKL